MRNYQNNVNYIDNLEFISYCKDNNIDIYYYYVNNDKEIEDAKFASILMQAHRFFEKS
jgi:hypothetical protein